MRAVSGHIFDLWTLGGPFVGDDGKPHTRVTVEVGWTLGEYNAQVGDFKKAPLRYVQNEAQTQVETEIPNVQSVSIERSIDQDAASITISVLNQQQNAYGVTNINSEEYGNPGYLTFSRGTSAAATTLWGHTTNAWLDVLVPNALIRTYQGFGGTNKTIANALADGNIIQTGLWLLDEVKPSTGGRLELSGRDMGKLLIDQTLYPPLVPQFDVNGCDVYPLRYARYFYIRGSQTQRIPYGVAATDNPNGRKICGIEYALEPANPCRPSMEGYWMPGTDGGVFAYGYIDFHGSLADATLQQPIRGLASTASNNGYWLVGGDGGVFAFGDAQYYGSLPSAGITTTTAIAIERSAGGNGYIISTANGGAYGFGDASSIFGVIGVSGSVVGLDVKRVGVGGYWLCTNTGHVYAVGGAGHYGGINGAFSDVVGFAATSSNNGYYLLRSNGAIYCYGDAQYYGSPAQSGITLNDPATDIAVHPNGYWIAAEDGGVFSYGSVQFYGSLPGPWPNRATIDGNYFDITDIIKDLCRWSGFWLHDGGVDPEPHGTFESTGIVSNDQDGRLAEDLFDKIPPIDAINQLKAVVGYQFHVDELGGASFTSPNWWTPGNYLPNGSHTNVIPEINEGVNLINYGVLYGDKSMVSRIIIANYQPLVGSPGTIVTDKASAYASTLRGLSKPFMWVNKLFITAAEQAVMAELIDMQINFRRRVGSVSCVANPLLQLGDQVRIVERETSETYVHYVRSISTTHDLITGRYDMTVQTNWLGDSGAWAIFVPSVIVRPSTVATSVAQGALDFAVSTPKPNRIITTTTVPTPSISAPNVVTVSTISLSVAVGAPTVTNSSLIAVAAIVAVTSVPVPSFSGETVVLPAVLATMSPMSAHLVVTGANLTPSAIDTISSLDSPSLLDEETVTPNSIHTESFLDDPPVLADSAVTVTQIVTVTTVETVTVVAVDGGQATATPAVIATVVAGPTPSVVAVAVVAASALNVPGSMAAPTVTTGTTVVATTIATLTAISAPAVTTEVSITVALINMPVTLPAPTVTTAAAGGFVINLLVGNS